MKPVLSIKNKNQKEFSGKEIALLLTAVLDKGAGFRFTATGESMYPFIKNGDIITLYSIRGKKLRTGDVVAVFYESNDKLMIHRIIKNHDDICIVKGDNNPGPDKTVSIKKVLGAVKRIERDEKKIHLGMGKERFIVAWLSRKNFFSRFIPKIRLIRNAVLNVQQF